MDDFYGESRNNIFVLLTKSCKLLLVVNVGILCGAAGSGAWSNVGRLWWKSCRYKCHCGAELVPRVLVDDISSFPQGWGRTLVLIFRKNFRKIPELHGKKYPLSNFNMHLTQFRQTVGIIKERIRAIIWVSKKGDQHFGTVSMTIYNLLLRFTGQQLITNLD